MIEKVREEPPTVKVLWDAMPDLEEESSTSNQVLQPNKWKKKSKFGWQMDIDVEMFENYHDPPVDSNDDAEEDMNVSFNDVDTEDEDDDDDDMNSDNIGSHDGEESVLYYGADSSSEGA